MVKLVPATNMNSTMTIHSMHLGLSKWAIEPVNGENPPVETVVKEWVTAAYRSMPASQVGRSPRTTVNPR